MDNITTKNDIKIGETSDNENMGDYLDEDAKAKLINSELDFTSSNSSSQLKKTLLKRSIGKGNTLK